MMEVSILPSSPLHAVDTKKGKNFCVHASSVSHPRVFSASCSNLDSIESPYPPLGIGPTASKSLQLIT
eukprot:scaffold11072_cov99-Skeletonema_dohrnii-CCMP3373.AAC.8